MLKLRGVLLMFLTLYPDLKWNNNFMDFHNDFKRLNVMTLHAIQMLKKLKYELDFEKKQKSKNYHRHLFDSRDGPIAFNS